MLLFSAVNKGRQLNLLVTPLHLHTLTLLHVSGFVKMGKSGIGGGDSVFIARLDTLLGLMWRGTLAELRDYIHGFSGIFLFSFFCACL